MVLLRDSKVMKVIIEYEDGNRSHWSRYDATEIEMALRRELKQPMTYNMTPQEKIDYTWKPPYPLHIALPYIVKDNDIERILKNLKSTPIGISMGYHTKMEEAQDNFDAVIGTQIISRNYDAEIVTSTTNTIGSFVIEGDSTDTALKKLEEFGFKKRSSVYGNIYFEGDSDKLPILKVHGIFLKEYVPKP